MVRWSELDEDFAWEAWAEVDGPEPVVAVQATFVPVEEGEEVVLTLADEGERWSVWGLQEAVGLHCCTTYEVRFIAEDSLGRTDELWRDPLLELP